MNNKFAVIAALCLAATLNANAAPVQTFSGVLTVGDDLNALSALVGLDVDIDGDGNDDINVVWCGTLVCGTFGWSGNVRTATGAGAEIFIDGPAMNTIRFAGGESIGPASPLASSSSSSAGGEDFFGGTFSGEFFDGLTGTGLRGFAGFAFMIGADTHFGWIDIELNPYTASTGACTGDPGDGCVRILGYGYETTPDTAIAAGAAAIPLPASVWLLGSALCAATYRRRKRYAGI